MIAIKTSQFLLLDNGDITDISDDSLIPLL